MAAVIKEDIQFAVS